MLRYRTVQVIDLMNPQLKHLIELQKTDNEIAALEQSIAAIPQQIKSGATDLIEKQNHLNWHKTLSRIDTV